MHDDLFLDEIAEKVWEIIKESNLNPLIFSIAMVLKKDEFDHLAIEHPEHIHPDAKPSLILKTKTEADGTQWDIQIMSQFSPGDISDG